MINQIVSEELWSFSICIWAAVVEGIEMGVVWDTILMVLKWDGDLLGLNIF